MLYFNILLSANTLRFALAAVNLAELGGAFVGNRVDGRVQGVFGIVGNHILASRQVHSDIDAESGLFTFMYGNVEIGQSWIESVE